MAIKRKPSNPALDESPTKRVTKLKPSHVPDPPIGDKIRAARLPAPATPRGKTYGKRRTHVPEPAASPTRVLRGRNVSLESEDELDSLPTLPVIAAAETPSRTRSGKVRSPRDAEDIPTPSPSPSKRSTRSSAKVSPTKLTPRKTASPAKRRPPPKARTPTPVPDSEEEEDPEPSPFASCSRASSPTEVTSPVEEPDSTAPPAVDISAPLASSNILPSISSEYCLNAQKREILRATQNPPDLVDEEEDSTNRVALKQLSDLLQGTVVRGEGNSCLLLGPRGSGKTRIANQCITDLPEQPIVLRLSGWSQLSDRLAMREIAYQLSQQTGKSFLAAGADDDVAAGAEDGDEDPNPFLETSNSVTMSLPPSTHLPALISLLPTLSRPTVIILDAFDLFAQHPRQSLLYCLLDTVQSCRAGVGSKGIAVIGMTTRVDAVTLLEKRVKSRFSGRTLRTAPPSQSQDWVELARGILCSKIKTHGDSGEVEKWQQQWEAGVESFLQDEATISILKETFSVTKDVRVLARLLVYFFLLDICYRGLKDLLDLCCYPAVTFFAMPYIQPDCFRCSESAVPAPVLDAPRQVFLSCFPLCCDKTKLTFAALPYPSICLLIACVHSETAGHPTFTFEMLHERVRDQIRYSISAPVEVNGSSIGMPKCPRSVLMSAFESLVSAKIVAPTVAPSASVGKEFVKYRAVVGREDVKKAIETRNDVNLTKWLKKATAQ
ncbi:AAA domain-containing protein [Mycena venus]|uniref:AAA domain-containing protein n=1 Tax=Mycena venus TaxID=2733690 RepID=A0A8H7CYN5_9AGAR|nr:AAA domain-containing protein [Mycena venus]